MLQSFRLSGTSFVTRPVHIPRNGLEEEQPGRDTHTHIYIYTDLDGKNPWVSRFCFLKSTKTNKKRQDEKSMNK